MNWIDVFIEMVEVNDGMGFLFVIEDDTATRCCYLEQMWAIRERLAENPNE